MQSFWTCTGQPVYSLKAHLPVVQCITVCLGVAGCRDQVALNVVHLDRVPLTLRRAQADDAGLVAALQRTSDPLLQACSCAVCAS